jgi:hypothetical protein
MSMGVYTRFKHIEELQSIRQASGRSIHNISVYANCFTQPLYIHRARLHASRDTVCSLGGISKLQAFLLQAQTVLPPAGMAFLTEISVQCSISCPIRQTAEPLDALLDLLVLLFVDQQSTEVLSQRKHWLRT